MQEKPNWRNTENDDDDGSDSRDYGSYRPEQPVPPHPVRPRAPVHVPISEGLIWRQSVGSLESFSPEGSKDKKDGDDDEEEEKEDSKQPVVAKKDKPNARQEADNAVRKTPVEGVDDETTEGGTIAGEDERPDSIDSPDSNVFVYPEEAAPVLSLESAKDGKGEGLKDPEDPENPENEGYVSSSTAEGVAASLGAAPEASVPEYYQSAQPTAEAVPPALRDYYEQQAAQPPAIPPELQINQPPLPPIGPPLERAGYAQPPEYPTGQYGYGPGMYPPQNVEYSPVQTAANTPAERVPVQVDNHRHGEPLAVVAGLGVVAEHIGRKRADSEQREQFDRFAEETRQQQKNTAAQYQRTQEQQRALTAEQQRQVAEMQRMRTAQERLAAVPVAPYALENAPSTVQAPQRFESAATSTPQPFGSIEHPLQQQQQQQKQGAEGQQQAPRTPERPFEPTPEGMPVKPQQHVEHSSWHNIVVDKHGHEVTDAIHYGQEFHRQREHEILQDRVSSNPTGGGGGGGGGGGVAVGGGIASQQQDQPVLPAPYQHPHQQGTLPSGMTSPTLPPGHSSRVDPQHQLPPTSQKEVTSNIANPWFWLMLALIIIAFFTAALI